MAPRRRKVVVAASNTPETVKYSIAVIEMLLSAQKSETTHAKLVKQLKQMYGTVQHDLFMKSFIKVIMCEMQREATNPYANNVLKFCAKFVADPEYSEQAVTHPIMSSIFDWLLGTISSAQLVRFRICQLVNLILNALGMDAALDDSICDKILRYMLERIRDVSQHVRVQAVLALQRLQDPNLPDDPVVRAYVYHLDKDPSPKVRQTIISSLGRNYRLIPHVLERLWDVDEGVRRHTYMQMSSYPVRHYKVEQRLTILEQGLGDHSEAVRKVMRNVMIPQWFESYQRNYVALVEALKLDADDKEMDRFLKTAKMVLMEIFRKHGVEDMARLLNFGDDSLVVPLTELTIERAICWQALLEYLKHNDSDRLEDYMIELSKFCEYIKSFVANPTASAVTKSASVSVVSNQTSSPSQSETMDKLQQLYVQYSLQLLMDIVLMYDFGDEFGRESLKLVLSHILCHENLFETNVRLIMQTFEKLITDVETRLNYFVELVSSVLEPSRQDVSNSSRQLVDAYLDKHPELTKLKLDITELRVKILELKEQESALSAQKDYAGAQLISEEVNVCLEKYANLVKPLAHEMSQCTANSSSTIGSEDASSMTLLFRDSMLKPRRVTQATVEKCLQICFYLVNNPSVHVLTPPVCNLYPTFISRYVQSGQLSTRNWALRTSTAFSMLYDGLSKETFQLLYQQLLNTASSRLWKTAIECVFELLDMYGFEHFDLESEDASSKDDSRAHRNSRQLFNRQNSSYHDSSLDASSCNGNEFYKMSVHFMDSCNDNDICAAILEGFCRLILHGKCTSADIMSKLLLRYFNPTTEPEMQQLLGIFFQSLISRRRQELMQKALMSTLFLVLEAPNESPLAEVRPETVIKFVVESTRPVFCNPGVNPHNAIAASFLRVMRDNITRKDLLKLLSKALHGLDIKDDAGLRGDLVKTTDEILKEPYLDPKTIKNLTTFRELMLGKIRETLTFSSSRTPVSENHEGEEKEEEEGDEEQEEDEEDEEEGEVPKKESFEESTVEDEETEQEENEYEAKSEERAQINKSILLEDADADLLASPMKDPGSAVSSPVRLTRPDTPDSGVKSLRRSMLGGLRCSAAATKDSSGDGKFKVPDASTLCKMQAASARVRAAFGRSKVAASSNKVNSGDEDFEIPATQEVRSSEEAVSSTDEDELVIPETQPAPSPRANRKMPIRKPSASSSSSSAVSSSSDSEAVEGSPNNTLIRINRSVRPMNKVAEKKLLERKVLQTPGRLPRATTRRTARMEEINRKVMTRKSLSELQGPTVGDKSTKASKETRPTARRSKNAPQHLDASSPRSSPKTLSRASARSARVSTPAGSQTNVNSSPAGKRTRERPTGGKQSVATTTAAESSSGLSTSSPIIMKRAAIVLTPLVDLRRMKVASGLDTTIGTSSRRSTRKATRTDKE